MNKIKEEVVGGANSMNGTHKCKEKFSQKKKRPEGKTYIKKSG
jgi:hypothetical protein